MRKKIFRSSGRKLNRSMAGNSLLFTIMGIFGVLMALPLVMIVNNALKPLDELFQYPLPVSSEHCYYYGGRYPGACGSGLHGSVPPVQA